MKQFPLYFYICLMAFIFACSVGLNWALSYQELVSQGSHGTFNAWRPAIGIAILGSALILNFVCFAIQIQKSTKKQNSGRAGNAVDLPTPTSSAT